jgi:secreted trypsin-like serine protease
MVNFIDAQDLQQCAGSIIDTEWILTAAHCFLFTSKPGPLYNNYTFYLADHNLNFTDPKEYEVEASKVYIHPKYVIGDWVSPGDYDIALIKLSKPLNYTNYVQPICVGIKEDIFTENDTCVLTGWGNVKNVGKYHRSPFLKEVDLDLVSLEECNSNTSYKGHVSDRFLCAGRKQGGIDGCYGDSGGPYQCERNGTWIQLGIMIWGIGCAEANHYGVYTDVRVLQPFIEAIQLGKVNTLWGFFWERCLYANIHMLTP